MESKGAGGEHLPEYHLRAMYRLDWKVSPPSRLYDAAAFGGISVDPLLVTPLAKVCFMKWAVQHGRVAAYHAYVEDDSFLCTANLMHQVQAPACACNVHYPGMLTCRSFPFASQAKLLIQLNATLTAASLKRASNSSGSTANATATINSKGTSKSSNAASVQSSVPAVRAGYPMYDGFDDSSTFMSREVVTAFAGHYPEPGTATLNHAPHINPNP